MSTMPLLWMFALNFFCFAASTRFDAPALTFLVVVFVFVRRRRDNNKELSERVFYERKKRQMRCSRRRRRVLLLLNRARCTPSSSPVCFLNASTSHQLLRGETSSRLSLSHSNHHSTRAKTRHKNKSESTKNEFFDAFVVAEHKGNERERIKHAQR